MKRFLPMIPVFLFLLLNACGNQEIGISNAQWTAVSLSQTATMWTPTVTLPPDPNESKIVDWLNEELSSEDAALEKMIDADYEVQDVLFPPASNSSSLIFRVDTRCQCSNHTPCCIPERMFAVIMGAMKNRAEKIIKEAPSNVSEMKVVCFNDGLRIGVVAALWTDVKAYLEKQINGHQFGSRVYTSSLP
jgi:hypothetical protein